MIKVYLAGSFSRQEFLRTMRAKLHHKGFLVVSRWLDEDKTADQTEDDRARIAYADVADIDMCDLMIIDVEYPSTKGGMWWEMGYAHGKRKSTVMVGDGTMLFCKTATIEFKTWEDLLSKPYWGDLKQ